MSIKQFINQFNFSKPTWENLPEGFPKLDLGGLTSDEVGKFNGIKTLWELSRPKPPVITLILP